PVATGRLINGSGVQYSVRRLWIVAAVGVLRLQLAGRSALVLVHPPIITGEQQSRAARKRPSITRSERVAELRRICETNAWLQPGAADGRIANVDVLRIEQAKPEIELPPPSR